MSYGGSHGKFAKQEGRLKDKYRFDDYDYDNEGIEMNLFEQLKADRIQAMKDKDNLKKDLLGTLIGDVSKNDKNPSDEIIIPIIKKFIKNVEANQELWEDKPEYQDFWVSAEKEKNILETYLPKQLSVETIKDYVEGMIVNGFGMKEVMAYFKENHSGQYDGKVVSDIVKSLK